jgi:hypothetical protein
MNCDRPHRERRGAPPGRRRWGALLAFLLGSAWGTGAAANELPQLAPIESGQPFTFAVFGDNRGDNSGQQPAAFHQILEEVNRSSPAFAVNTGDMIYGLTTNEAVVRTHWKLYRQATASLRAPLFHLPGNHDIWSEDSARLYAELVGPPYYVFDYGRARFIMLDCETDACRLGTNQFAWLSQQLAQAGERLVFVFVHRPLFPVDGAIGSSMDAYPGERDALHQLLVKHGRNLGGVFLGHEHLYHFQKRDGVPYYITGGAGANLYAPPELGGFHHFLLVHVRIHRVEVELRKVGAVARPLEPARPVRVGELLESWEEGLNWYPWDYTVRAEITAEQASQGRRGFRLNFDLAQCPWPVLSLPFRTPRNLDGTEALHVDVYVPEDNYGTSLSITPYVEGATKHEANALRLQPGWNTVSARLPGAWLPHDARRAVRSLGWMITSDGTPRRGHVVFDDFRTTDRAAARSSGAPLQDSWERPLWWRILDESVHAETTSEFATRDRRGLVLYFDAARCRQARLVARLNPPWDLRPVDTLSVDVHVPLSASDGLAVGLALWAEDRPFHAQPIALRPGWNKVSAKLDPAWLREGVRAAMEQVEWSVSFTNPTGQGRVTFDNFRAGAD